MDITNDIKLILNWYLSTSSKFLYRWKEKTLTDAIGTEYLSKVNKTNRDEK